MAGVVQCRLAAFSLGCAWGTVRPLALRPLRLWAPGWKALWLLRVALPAALEGQLGRGQGGHPSRAAARPVDQAPVRPGHARPGAPRR